MVLQNRRTNPVEFAFIWKLHVFNLLLISMVTYSFDVVFVRSGINFESFDVILDYCR